MLGSDCPAGTLNWTVSSNCTAAVGATPHGALASVIDSTNDVPSPGTGAAAFTCSNGTYSATPIAGATCIVTAPPTNLALVQSPGNRLFTVSWTAGTNNGNCKLQYYKDGTTWTDLAGTYDCDANTTNAAAALPSSDNWTTGPWNAGGLSVRLAGVADSVAKGTFPQNVTCSNTTSPTNYNPTPDIDEDCNLAWDNKVVTATDGRYASTNCAGGVAGDTYNCPATCADDINGDGSAEPFNGIVVWTNGIYPKNRYSIAGCTGAVSPLNYRCLYHARHGAGIPVSGTLASLGTFWAAHSGGSCTVDGYVSNATAADFITTTAGAHGSQDPAWLTMPTLTCIQSGAYWYTWGGPAINLDGIRCLYYYKLYEYR